jgi:trehalose 6-phosphate synthase/phosphatase
MILKIDPRWSASMTPKASASTAQGRLIVVSNRAPFRIVRKAGKKRIEPTVGGVATTFLHLLEMNGGLWIAWSGGTETPPALEIPPENPRFAINFIGLSEDKIAHYYWGMCNRGLWPLMHMMPQYCHFGARDWAEYRVVNQRFGQRCLGVLEASDTIWIQDFHLALLPALLREGGSKHPIGFFWHIPFPPPDILKILPWHNELLGGMLGADLIGFHTPAHVSAFFECCEKLLGAQVDRESGCVSNGGRTTRVGAFPIGVPARYFEQLGSDPKVKRRVAQIKRGVGVEKIVLGVDRLDYTKGLVKRLEGFERFLERSPQYHKRVTLVQIAVPSRTRVPEYLTLARQVESLVVDIVSRFSTEGWLPIRYLHKQYDPEVLVAYYLSADVALVTPLADGMNLVAKEYVAARSDQDGVLILSELAGAAVELKAALLVNPYDIDEIAGQLRHALELEPAERRRRMGALRATVRKNTLTDWSQSFLEALRSASMARNHRGNQFGVAIR